jgi:hypothetical protein
MSLLDRRFGEACPGGSDLCIPARRVRTGEVYRRNAERSANGQSRLVGDQRALGRHLTRLI